MSCVFGQTLSSMVEQLSRQEQAEEAMLRLGELVPLSVDSCLASSSLGELPEEGSPAPDIAPEIQAVLTSSGKLKDERPCISCGDD